MIDLRLGRLPPPAPVVVGPVPGRAAGSAGSGASAGGAATPDVPGGPPGSAGHPAAPPSGQAGSAGSRGAAQPPAAGRDDPSNYYVVQPGDTLSSIAQKQLGSATKADELVRLNRLADADGIVAGQVLRLR